LPFFAFFCFANGLRHDLNPIKKRKNSKMENPNSSTVRKVQIVNPVYKNIFNFLKTGGHEITKALRKTHGAKPSGEIRAIREELSKVLNSTNPAIPEIRHIRILANAIRITKKQLEDSKILFHSKGLRQTREYAIFLLKEVSEAIKKQTGGLPMVK
jgi:hypothetical protein